MFGTWYFCMILICLFVNGYTYFWLKDANLKYNKDNKKRKSRATKVMTFMLLFIPIVNTIAVVGYLVVFVGLLFIPEETMIKEMKKNDIFIDRN